MFDATDIVAFANMVFDDSWFAMTAADFDFADKISVGLPKRRVVASFLSSDSLRFVRL